MKDKSTDFLVDITEFIKKNFKDRTILDMEIKFPRTSRETGLGFYTHGRVTITATDSQVDWSLHDFVFNSPENVDEETKSYFTNHTFPLVVNTANTLLWEE